MHVKSVIFLTLFLVGCSTAAGPDSTKLSVVTSFYPFTFVAESVGKELVQVAQVTPAGTEPHDFEPKAQDVAKSEVADVFVWSGLGVDAWAANISAVRIQKNLANVNASTLSNLLPLEAGDEHEESDYDPHFWLSPVHMKELSENIRDAFISLDPKNEALYSKNSNTLFSELTKLDNEFKQGLTGCSKHTIIVSHNAFRYLAYEYGFTALAISGIDPAEEPSAKKIAELADIAKAQGIRYIFFETLVSPKLAETLATEVGAESLTLNPLEGLTPEEQMAGENYFSVMRENLQSLQKALQCQ